MSETRSSSSTLGKWALSLASALAIGSCLINPKDYPLDPTRDGEGGSAGVPGVGGTAGSGGTFGGSGRSGEAGEAGQGVSSTAGEGGDAGSSDSSAAGSSQAGEPSAGSAGAAGGTSSRSCLGLAPKCGAAANDDCCSSPRVPGGTFTLDGSFGTSEATIATFALDKYEVTVGRFRTFVDGYAGPPTSGAGAHPLIAGSGWQSTWDAAIAPDRPSLAAAVQCNATYQTWNASRDNDFLPMNCVSWFEAFAFCAWDSGWLPTEAEWEYTAAGGAEERTYPWGNTPVPDNGQDSTAAYANYNGLGDGSAGAIYAFADILTVGSKPQGVGKFGQMDLAGSVWEWAFDWYGSYPAQCDNCANLSPATNRVLRGGGWNFTANYLTTTFRNGYNDRGYDIGFRCARAP